MFDYSGVANIMSIAGPVFDEGGGLPDPVMVSAEKCPFDLGGGV